MKLTEAGSLTFWGVESEAPSLTFTLNPSLQLDAETLPSVTSRSERRSKA